MPDQGPATPPDWGQPQNQQPLGPNWVPPSAATPPNLRPQWQQGRPPKQPMTTGSKVAIGIVGGVIFLGACGAIIGKDDSPSSQPPTPRVAAAPASNTAPAAPASPPPATVKPSPPAAPSTQAAPPPDPHNAAYYTAQKVVVWYASGGKDYTENIAKDANAIGADGANADADALASDCASLRGHVVEAQNYMAIPDPEGQEHWRKGLDLYKQAALDCIDGASNVDAAAIRKSGSELEQGTHEITSLSARVAEISAAAK